MSASVAASIPLPFVSQRQNLSLHWDPPTAALRMVSASEALTIPSPLVSPQVLPRGSVVVVVDDVVVDDEVVVVDDVVLDDVVVVLLVVDEVVLLVVDE